MLKSSEFNSAVPKFTNGNYANNPIDPTNIEEPTMQDYVRGVEPLETLPAQWWNWLCNQFTSRFNKLNTYVKNIFDELTQLLSLVNVTPDGTESTITTGQLKNAFKELYPTYVSNKLELGTTYVKQTTTVNGHALSGNVTVSKSDVGLGNVPNVTTNNQTPTYTVASSLTNLTSGEVLSTAFGKIAKAISSLISHIANTSNPHSVTKAQVGLGSVVNTGDSATPVENGTTKFTTGGAYTSLGKKISGKSIIYYSGLSTIPENKYILIFERLGAQAQYMSPIHLTGIFANIGNTFKQMIEVEIDFRNAPTVTLYATANLPFDLFDIIPTWDSNTNTARVYLEVKTIYAFASLNQTDYYTEAQFIKSELIGYSSMQGTPSNYKFSSERTIIQSNVKSSVSSDFNTDISYSVGDYVLHNSLLYKCTTAHLAGAWNSSHFTAVTVGNELEALDNKIDESIDVESNLPTDAVLHYSFDELPNVPNGVANYRPDFFTSDGGWSSDIYCNISHSNGMLKMKSAGNSTEWRTLQNFPNIAKKIITLKIRSNFDNARFILQSYNGSSYTFVFDKTVSANEWVTLIGVIPESHTSYIKLQSTATTDISRAFDIKDFYIGDGSYSTPVINNFNGWWNSANQSGVTVDGVSGNGLKCLKGNSVVIDGSFSLNKNFSISFWVNPDNDTTGLIGSLFTKSQQFIVRNGMDYSNNLTVSLYGANSTLLSGSDIGSLLTPNKWTNLIFVRDGTVLKVFKDGVKTHNLTLADNTISVNNNEIYINHPACTRTQSYDDLLIFDRALTETEAMALYLNKANTPKYYGEVPVTRKVNGHTLEEDITLTKADVGLDNVANKDLSNVVNTGDSDTPISGGTTKFTTGGAYTELANKVDKTTTVNGHALSGNVTVTKGDVGLDNVANKDLSNVVNTGDSATPIENGTTKFTTGGAYTELNKKFDKTSAGDQVTYSLSGNTLTITSLS